LFGPEPQICDWLQQNPWMPDPTTSLPPSETWPGAQQRTVAPGTWRFGGQHTCGDDAVMPPIWRGSCLAHLFGRGHQVRLRLPG
jgi:hypothetical protein